MDAHAVGFDEIKMDAVTVRRWAALCFCSLVTTTAADLQSQPRLVGTLHDPGVVRGCSWTATSADIGSGLIFLAEYDESLIVMNIDGRDIHLSRDPSSGAGRPSRIGDRVVKLYTAESVRVETTYTTTWVCPPDTEGCEVTRFDVTFVVKRGDQIETVKAVGGVGC
jgi:hypothetical protein